MTLSSPLTVILRSQTGKTEGNNTNLDVLKPVWTEE